MKNLFLAITTIACITLASCSNDTPSHEPIVKKRVTKITSYEATPKYPMPTYPDSKTTFTYDADGRLSEYVWYGYAHQSPIVEEKVTDRFIYDNLGRLMEEDVKRGNDNSYLDYFTYKGDTIISSYSKDTLTIDDKGRMTVLSQYHYHYLYTYDENNNIIKKVLKSPYGIETDVYTYDQNISPFRYNKTPNWVLSRLSDVLDTGNNNCLSDQHTTTQQSEQSEKYEYEYDKDGYATKMYWVDTETGKREDGSYYEYEYEVIKN